MENPYQPSTVEDLPQASPDQADQLHDPSFVMPLYKASRALKIVGFIALINAVASLLTPVYTTSLNTDGPVHYFEQTHSPNLSLIIAGIIAFFAFLVLYRPIGGRILGFLFGSLFLISATLNAVAAGSILFAFWPGLIGVLTFYGLWNGKKLFGPKRFSHKQLRDAKEAIERGLTPI